MAARRIKAGTAKCPHCRRTVNSLSLYITGIGQLCYLCLHGKDATK